MAILEEISSAAPAAEQPTPAFPDYMTDPNAVLGDTGAQWRYGQPPDYTKTRKFYAETKRYSHEPKSLSSLVENLVKSWEIEASFKTRISDWRTIDPAGYTFAINGLEPCTGEEMLKLGTYNAIIPPGEYYDPVHTDFASSHKTFKRMMPTFAWEVIEVYSGPPIATFRWRHWGEMKNDYVGWNSAGEKVTVKAAGQPIDVQGVTVAHLTDKLQVTKLETWFDSGEMFRQMDPERHAVKKPAVPAADVGGVADGKEKGYDCTAESGPAAVNGGLVDAGVMSGCPVMGGRVGMGGCGGVEGLPEMNAE